MFAFASLTAQASSDQLEKTEHVSCEQNISSLSQKEFLANIINNCNTVEIEQFYTNSKTNAELRNDYQKTIGVLFDLIDANSALRSSAEKMELSAKIRAFKRFQLKIDEVIERHFLDLANELSREARRVQN